MKDHQQKVLDFIKHDRTLTGARNVYNSLPNKSLSFLASINRMRSTDANIKAVCYQLFKTVGLPERQMLALWGNPVVPKQEEKEVSKITVVDIGEKSLAERVLEFEAKTADWQDIQVLAADISDRSGAKAEGRSKVDLLAFIEKAREFVIEEQSNEVPVEVKKSIKLREQFPFLKEKDCPEVLKVLVNDLISCYENYRDGHAKLFESMTEAEEQILAREIVDNFIENKEIYNELEHYGKSGQLLGEHAIFTEQKIKTELDKLTGEELNKKYNALRKNISTNNKRAEKAEDAEKKASYEAAVKDYTWQLEYVQGLLKKK